MILSSDTVPPAFKAFFAIWSTVTPQIQALPAEQKHDLARIICGHEPLTPASTHNPNLRRMALDMRAVAIEISQRRTFQERYQSDLQAALDHGRPPSEGRRTPSPLKATFVPPPGYESEKPLPASPSVEPQDSPRRHARPLTPTEAAGRGFLVRNPDSGSGSSSEVRPITPPAARTSQSVIASPPRKLHRIPSPFRSSASTGPPTTTQVPSGHRKNTSSGSGFLELPSAARPGASRAGPSTIPRPASPSILTPSDPAILTIRETLYAALADVISRTREVRSLLKTDPGRAYFASVGLAILEVCIGSITPEGNVRGVLGNELRVQDVPKPYVPLMKELQAIGLRSRELETEDNDKAIELLTAGDDTIPEPRMDRVRRMLIKGVARGWEEAQSIPTPPPPEPRGSSRGARAAVPAPSEEDAMAGAAFESQQRRSGRNPEIVRSSSRDRSPGGTVLSLVNRINALALAMVRLPAFRERQNEVFKVLAGAR